MSQVESKTGLKGIEDKYISLRFYGKDESTGNKFEEVLEIANKEYEPCVIYADMQMILRESIIPPYGKGTIWIWNLSNSYTDIIEKCEFVEIFSGEKVWNKDEYSLGKYKIMSGSGFKTSAKSGVDIPYEIRVENAGHYLLRKNKHIARVRNSEIHRAIKSIIKKVLIDYTDFIPKAIFKNTAKSLDVKLTANYRNRYNTIEYIKKWTRYKKVRDEFYINRNNLIVKHRLTDILDADEKSVELYKESCYNKSPISSTNDISANPVRDDYDVYKNNVICYRVMCDENEGFMIGNRIVYTFDLEMFRRLIINGVIISIEHELEINSKQLTSVYFIDTKDIRSEMTITDKLDQLNIFDDLKDWLKNKVRSLGERFEGIIGMKILAGLLIESTNPILNFSTEDSENIYSTDNLFESIITRNSEKEIRTLMTSPWAGEGYGLIFPHYKGEYGIIMPVGDDESTAIVGLYYWLDKPTWLPQYNSGDLLLKLKDGAGQFLFSQIGQAVLEATSIRIDANSAGGFTVRPIPEGVPGTITINGDVQIKLGETATLNVALSNHVHQCHNTCHGFPNMVGGSTSNTTKTVAE